MSEGRWLRAALPAGLVLVCAAMPGAAAEVNRAEVEEAIDQGVQFLVSKQEEDGHWAYPGGGGAESVGFKVGQTGLVVLALENSGSKRAEVQMAIKKGLSYILQQPPEPMTYTAGVTIPALFAASPTEFRGPISTYAWMLCAGQKREGVQIGSWCYNLPALHGGGDPMGLMNHAPPVTVSDDSNTQFGILGLVYAEKAGFQVPRIIWERAREHYAHTQNKDGSWQYTSAAVAEELKLTAIHVGAPNMTLAGTVSIYLCDEALADRSHQQCKTPVPNLSHEAGLKWIADNWAQLKGQELTWVPYGWYACERLGMLIGYSELGGHDWYQEGAPVMKEVATGKMANIPGEVANASFAVLFLARGRQPIIINKLKREGDWNLHRYDLKNLVEHISGPWQIPSQWRIVSLDATVDYLLRVPISL